MEIKKNRITQEYKIVTDKVVNFDPYDVLYSLATYIMSIKPMCAELPSEQFAWGCYDENGVEIFSLTCGQVVEIIKHRLA